ncbi:GTPase activating protein [Coprinopsis cinerea okayama7|uniref:GTPase activating protein n=1 Tax=Coprinopsis cinerea (strain Okayama-7 / 130 / ATCC MYA-4618 / FGSC 9003) TaxID=240176 RepID=A8NA36_COPC7|nr:GTPase activating protein [Coprinopsis cinerea okayama7\|eukprot:XP_001831692.2 GTPase activating protein [Coprinopsis cinerea okayama7\
MSTATTTEDSFNASHAWPSDDHLQIRLPGGQAPTIASTSSSSPHLTSTSPLPPRSSTDSEGRPPYSPPWNDSVSLERRDTLATIQSVDPPNLMEPGFDESVLRQLCELDCGVPLLLDRIKQSVVSCREASIFFKKRAAIEEEYGKTLQKLARTTAEVYALNDGKAGTFVSAWMTTMRVHEMMAENRLRFAQRLNEMSEELATLVKEVDKNRKQTKDLASRYERALHESEAATEKCKNRLDFSSEELERLLLQKEGESFKDTAVKAHSGGVGGKRAIGKAVAKGGLLLKGKNPGNIQRQEDDIRGRVSAASDQYRKAVTDTQAMRQEYFNLQLPRILRSLKECADEVDLGTQYHLTRYAFLFESIVLSDGSTLVPTADEGVGLKATIETIDNRGDFRTYMQNYVYARGGMSAARRPKRDGPSQDYIPPVNVYGGPNYAAQNNAPNGIVGLQDKGRPTFGVDLAEQMARDNVEVPLVVVKCCQAIEKYGIRSQGIYRVSGMSSKVTNLKQRLDKDLDSVDLDAPEWSGDINTVASVLKMWLRELPDPLMTNHLHQGFIDAAKIENDRLRHIRLHERVNDLPDPNYSTLKYFLGHLQRITQHAEENSMSVQNLAIVFGPTLFAQLLPGHEGGAMADASFQNQVRILSFL